MPRPPRRARRFLGALSDAGALTTLGRRMVEFPLDPPLAKMLIHAEQEGCAAEVLTVVAMLSMPSVFYRPREREEESDAMREKFFVPESDHLTLLNVYQRWAQYGFRSDWCARHFVHAKALKKVKEVREQLLEICKQHRFVVQSCGTEWDVVRKCVCSAYFDNASRMKSMGEYLNMRTGMPCHMHPSAALYGMGVQPDYVIYHELVLTSKARAPPRQRERAREARARAPLRCVLHAIARAPRGATDSLRLPRSIAVSYVRRDSHARSRPRRPLPALAAQEFMMNVTAVDAHWLAELGPMFFSVKEGHETRAEKRRKQQAQKRRMEETAAVAEKEKEAAELAASTDPSRSRIQRMATPGGDGGISGGALKRAKTPRRVGM